MSIRFIWIGTFHSQVIQIGSFYSDWYFLFSEALQLLCTLQYRAHNNEAQLTFPISPFVIVVSYVQKRSLKLVKLSEAFFFQFLFLGETKPNQTQTQIKSYYELKYTL